LVPLSHPSQRVVATNEKATATSATPIVSLDYASLLPSFKHPFSMATEYDDV
jgi:hypothetical protein